MARTRIKRYADGRMEIIRVLSLDVLDRWLKDDPLAYEKSILWLEDISKLKFVRAGTVDNAKGRRGPLLAGPGTRIVGYAKLTANAPHNPANRCYVRRVFYLRPEDRFDASIPRGAVDPTSVLPGEHGHEPVERPTSSDQRSTLKEGERPTSSDQRSTLKEDS